LLALKIQETRLLEAARGQKPLLLLDDVFSELDGARRRSLTNFIKDYQSFITTTDADIVDKKFTKAARLISLG
jgi:DNA replication and repair protein RecF